MPDPSQLPPEDFEAQLKSWSGETSEPAPSPSARDDLSKYQMLPATREALADLSSQVNKGLDPDFLSRETQAMGVRPGVAFDPNRGAPASVRAALSFDRNTLNQYKLLTKVYGANNVDISDRGQFIVRNQDNPTTGLKEDFPVDPVGVDVGDIAGMSGDVLPILMGAVGAKFGGKMGSGPMTRFGGGFSWFCFGCGRDNWSRASFI